jgi:4-hydroxy-3-polyprenylbenzoate decarboxylase
MQPLRDIRITPGKDPGLDPSAAPADVRKELGQPDASALLIDATRKWDYPPTSLPKREFMERARKIWDEEGLPPLKPKIPWFGYSLGYWTSEFDEEAELALKGEHFQTGEKLARNKIKG